MSKGLFAVLFLVVGLGTILSATNEFPVSYKGAQGKPKTPCVDYDPPSTSDTVTLNGIQYDLIKKTAGIPSYKVDEMSKIGTANGQNIYDLPGENYFEQDIGKDFVYADTGQRQMSNWIFNVYLKDGAPIPDFALKCKKIGGDNTYINLLDIDQFPPSGFNSTDVVGANGTLTEPAFVYDSLNIGLKTLQTYLGEKLVGTLFVKSKNKSYDIRYHEGNAYLIDGQDAYEYQASDRALNINGNSRDDLQLKTFQLVSTNEYSWFTPSCKPAIYLYPQTTENVSVQVKTRGQFTLTIPSYPQSGWDITADPDGTIHSGNLLYPYLYYESKLPDDLITKPKNGYVVFYTDLPKLYGSLLPRLGLSASETAAFKDYWTKSLPFSPYYFVGVMPEDQINALEPLTVKPQPDTVIRVRLYFQALNLHEYVDPPQITTPTRKGFVVSEWGGMVKLHPETTFTCVQ